MIICKDCGKSVAPEECRNLKVNDPKETFGFRLDQLCEGCFNERLKESAEECIKPVEKKERPIGRDEVLKLMNDAIRSKDRQVSIFVRGEVMNISITPYEEEEPKWIKRARNIYECSACGQVSEYPISYCTYCGERPKWNREREVDGDTEGK